METGLKVMDFHGYVAPELDAERVHEIFEGWGIYEAVSVIDFIENDLHKAIQQSKTSNRIHPIIMLPPQLRSAPKYLEKSVKMGFLGLKIHSQIHGVKYDDPTIFPTIRMAEDLGIPVFVHTGPSWSKGPYNEDMRVASTLPHIFPEVKFVFYEGDVSLARWLLKKFDNLYIDTSNFPGFQIGEIRMLFAWELEGQIIFGTDFCIKKDKLLSYHNHHWKILEDLKLDDATKKKILEENWKKVTPHS